MIERFGESKHIEKVKFTNIKAYFSLSNCYEKRYTWLDYSIRLYNFSSSEFMIKEINGIKYMFMGHKMVTISKVIN
jgi:hypothetical protein